MFNYIIPDLHVCGYTLSIYYITLILLVYKFICLVIFVCVCGILLVGHVGGCDRLVVHTGDHHWELESCKTVYQCKLVS